MTTDRSDPGMDTIEGDRGMPSVSARQPTSVKKGLAVLFLGGVLLLGLGLVYFWFVRGRQAADDAPIPKAEQVQNSVPTKLFGDAPPPPPEALQEAGVPIALADSAAPAPGPSGVTTPAPPRPQLDKSASDLMVSQERSSSPPAASRPSLADADGPGALGSMLAGTRTDASGAGVIGDRNMILAKGAFIDCVLQTRLDSTVPGMSACVVTRNIYSDNGKVLLIERGSTVIGEYQQAVQQGMNRIFVLWTRIKTPNGVVIALDSPGTDPLGGSGLKGKVNRHFWQRFGAAMLLSLVDDAAGTLANNTGDGNGGTFNYGNTSEAANDMASKTLESTINIPPTLYKNQGERINIFVARDLNFGNVYALRTR